MQITERYFEEYIKSIPFVRPRDAIEWLNPLKPDRIEIRNE